MRNRLFITISLTILTISSCLDRDQTDPRKIDLTDLWDTVRPIQNPDKGWYHHILDNGIGKYLIKDDSVFRSFPGMDHLYLRLCWAYLEPEEGVYNWIYIDDIVQKYVPLGYKISFRISSKETGTKPNSIPEEVNGIGYATPYWVRQAGAAGNIPSEYGPPVWTPDWDDPVYLKKLSNFHEAFAERYDAKDWVRYIDIGSIGDWGEGHTHFSTRIPPTMEEIKANIEIYLKHYKKSQLVVTDDLIYWNKPKNEVNVLFEYVKENGITFRDDSPMVKYYIENYFETWTVSHPHFFKAIYESKPTIFELEHYKHVKQNGFWLGKDGKKVIPGIRTSGATIFRNAMNLIHPTYIGFHGHVEEWLIENPNLTIELLNRCGYWYFPRSFKIVNREKSSFSFKIEWFNKGVAPAYSTYILKVKLIKPDNPQDYFMFEIEDSGNKNWMPGNDFTQSYFKKLDEGLKGTYNFLIQLYDEKTKHPVEIGLVEEKRDEQNFWLIGNVTF